MEEASGTALAPAVEAPTLAQALRATVAAHGDVVAVRTVDDALALTYSELLERAEALARGLHELGVRRGETVALMLSNRVEFAICDHACVQLGATPFSIYTTYPAEQIAFLVADAGTRVIITEQQFLDTVLTARADTPGVEHLIVVDGEAPAGTQALTDVEALPSTFDVAACAAQTRPDEIVTLIYTSGTTGPPKGVQIAHSNVMAGAAGFEQVLELAPRSRIISWLPAAHIAERMANHYIPTVFACTVTVCPDPKAIVGFLPQVRPAWFFAVPRVWEKLKAVLEAMQAAQPPEQQSAFKQAFELSLERLRLQQQGEPVAAELEARWEAVDGAAFAPLRTMLGLDEVEAVSVGAAPTAVDVLEFFHALGIRIGELWGMSETCGAGLTNRRDAIRIGTVGPPSPGVEVKLGDDGELLVRGAVVMPGYRNAPEKTAEALDGDGWLHTGDIAQIDEDGYVRIVDRKKELIINAAGKNMSPANIEAQLKAGSPLIGQACVIGDARAYNTALVVLDPDFSRAWASQHGLGELSFDELTRNELVLAAIQHGVDAANEHLARVEQIKRFTVVHEDWLPGGAELTPTMKLRRKPIAEKYADAIEALYS